MEIFSLKDIRTKLIFITLKNVPYKSKAVIHMYLILICYFRSVNDYTWKKIHQNLQADHKHEGLFLQLWKNMLVQCLSLLCQY